LRGARRLREGEHRMSSNGGKGGVPTFAKLNLRYEAEVG